MELQEKQVGVLSPLETRLSYLALRRYRVHADTAKELARRALETPGGSHELVKRLREKCRGLARRNDAVAGGCRVLGELSGLDGEEREALWLILRERPADFC